MIRGLEEHISDTGLNALSMDVRQNRSVMSYDKSNDFYRMSGDTTRRKGPLTGIRIEEKEDRDREKRDLWRMLPKQERTQGTAF